jgi:hypothetical protein
MRLFTISDTKEINLDKEWIFLIPEFREILSRDKGNRYKTKATSEFTWLFFYTDFSSPIRDWEDGERMKEAMYYAKMSDDYLPALKADKKLWEAHAKYQELQIKGSRPLRTLKVLYKALDAMDNHFESMDFSKTDKMGKLLHDPSDFITNAGKMNKMYDEIRNFEKRVEDDLKQASSTIRGPNSTLGDNEGVLKKWSEQDILEGSSHTKASTPGTTGSFADILKITQAEAIKENTLQRVTQQKLDDSEDLIELGEV